MVDQAMKGDTNKSEMEKTVTSQVTTAVVGVAADPGVPGVQQSAAPAIIDAVLNQILPMILHSTSNEPFWKARTFWSAVASAISIGVAAYGYTFNDLYQSIFVSVAIQGVSAYLAIRARYAKKPLGG